MDNKIKNNLKDYHIPNFDGKIIISLEDYNIPINDRKEYIKICIQIIGVDDLKYIFEKLFNFNDNEVVVGLYQKDFQAIYSESAGYGLLLQKSGDYQLMEDVKLEIHNSNCVIGILVNANNINFNFNNTIFEIYNIFNIPCYSIVICYSKNVAMYRGRIKSITKSYQHICYCLNIFTDNVAVYNNKNSNNFGVNDYIDSNIDPNIMNNIVEKIIIDDNKKKQKLLNNMSFRNFDKVLYQDDEKINNNNIDKVNTDKTKLYKSVNKFEQFYKDQHELQTYHFAFKKLIQYSKFDNFKMGIWECLQLLDKFVDDSDPDTENSQLQHALQTAESIRKAYPDPKYDWFHLTGLIHDCGKVLSSMCNEPQIASVGDTHPVGCQFDESIVFHQYFTLNPDNQHPIYSTKYGIYQPNCGLSNIIMSFGHDEYFYRVLTNNSCVKLPESALYIIRFHSFYPWHKNNAYQYLTNEKDQENLKWVQEFNKYDLYSKSNAPINVNTVKDYYISLIDKYIPGIINW